MTDSAKPKKSASPARARETPAPQKNTTRPSSLARRSASGSDGPPFVCVSKTGELNSARHAERSDGPRISALLRPASPSGSLGVRKSGRLGVSHVVDVGNIAGDRQACSSCAAARVASAWRGSLTAPDSLTTALLWTLKICGRTGGSLGKRVTANVAHGRRTWVVSNLRSAPWWRVARHGECS
jgi:hypothetical protein